MLPHLIIRHPDHRDPMPGQVPIPTPVIKHLIRVGVRSSIELDGQLERRGVEVEDERAEGMLATKLRVQESSIAQPSPHDPFARCQLPTQQSRLRNLDTHHNRGYLGLRDGERPLIRRFAPP